MIFDDNNTVNELRLKLIDYISTLDFNAKDLKDLFALDYEYLLIRYKKALGQNIDEMDFEQVIKEFVDNYHVSNPDSNLSDNEIIYVEDVLNPVNFTSIVQKKLDKCLQRLNISEEKMNNLALNEITDEDAMNIDKAQYESRKLYSITKNTVKKYQRILKSIQENYLIGRGR